MILYHVMLKITTWVEAIYEKCDQIRGCSGKQSSTVRSIRLFRASSRFQLSSQWQLSSQRSKILSGEFKPFALSRKSVEQLYRYPRKLVKNSASRREARDRNQRTSQSAFQQANQCRKLSRNRPTQVVCFANRLNILNKFCRWNNWF